jgi:nucleotide sugar dehydrogenase
MGSINENRILVVGLGEIGYNNAEYLSKLGIHADGFDINKEAEKRAINAGFIQKAAESFSGYDYYIVCISTHNPKDMFQPKLDGLFEIAKRISEEGKAGALISIESTITPGTSQQIKSLIDHKLHVAHVPHRYFGPEKERHGVKQLRVLGGCDKCCTDSAMQFYTNVLRIPIYSVARIEYAELCKVIENSERFLRISLAEELNMFCYGYGLSFEELRNAVNTKWNAEILEARQGIGGHCLPKDSQMYLDLTKEIIDESLLKTAKKVDIDYRRFLLQNRPPLELKSIQQSPTISKPQSLRRVEKESELTNEA